MHPFDQQQNGTECLILFCVDRLPHFSLATAPSHFRFGV